MAGKLLDKFMTFIGMDEEEYDDEVSGAEPERFSTTRKQSEEPQVAQPRRTPPSVIGSRRNYDEERTVTTTAAGLSSAVRMVVFQPQTYEDTQTIIDNLKARKPVIVNLENLNVEVAQRVLDFISGAIYALDGSVRKVSKGIFLLAPKGVDISGNFASGLPGSVRGKNYFNIPRRPE